MLSADIHFSDFFQVDPVKISDYGAFNISLIRDIPLFIDPFLLFNSENLAYQQLHNDIIKYLRFLRDSSGSKEIGQGLLEAWYCFPEVSQNWFGFSVDGNKGQGLGPAFGRTLHVNLQSLLKNFGEEQITRSSHLEKLTLIAERVGRDKISDLATNLIKGYLCEYTETFCLQFVDSRFVRVWSVPRAKFNYRTETWEARTYTLPKHGNDFVLLAPADVLTHSDTWISRRDLFGSFELITESISNFALRAQLNNYLYSVLTDDLDPKTYKAERERAINHLLLQYPEVIDHYIKYKEDSGDEAVALSKAEVDAIRRLCVDSVTRFADLLANETPFFKTAIDTYEECHDRIQFLKHVIEDKGGHRLFWYENKPIRREEDVHRLFKLVWYGSTAEISSEVNDGLGPVDFKASKGMQDKTLVEFKLGRSSKLKRNLQKQLETYKKASGAEKSIYVIVCFTKKDQIRVRRILQEVGLTASPDVVLIDARSDNKPSGSTA